MTAVYPLALGNLPIGTIVEIRSKRGPYYKITGNDPRSAHVTVQRLDENFDVEARDIGMFKHNKCRVIVKGRITVEVCSDG